MSNTNEEMSEAGRPSARQWMGFWSMIVQQTQNAFNDKMAQFILIPMAAAALGRNVESQAAMLIALPFVLFAPLAGWLSDRYSKRDVMVGSAVLQLVVLAWIAWAVKAGTLALAMAGFFMLAVQSAIFSPAKLGINKELVGTRHLGFATSLQQMTAMLAMLVGQIAAGVIFDKRYELLGETPQAAWQAAHAPVLVLAACALPAVMLAWIVPRVPAHHAEKLSARLAVSHFRHLAGLWREKGLRNASLGVAFFWGFAAYLNLWAIKLAASLSGGGAGFGTLQSIFMAAASLGMAAGFGAAAWLLRKRIELGWVPIAGLAMALLSLSLGLVPVESARHFLHPFASGWPGGADLVEYVRDTPWCAGFLLVLGMLAFFSALFLAPLNAWMQDHYPADRRGEMQSAVNLQDCLAAVISVVVIEGLVRLTGLIGMGDVAGLRWQMAAVALACLATTVWIVRTDPAGLIRVLCMAVIRAIYRVRAVDASHVPEKGGVLLLPNHVSFADAFFLATACPRPVRFVMDEVFARHPAIHAFTSIFDTVNIRRDQPLDAIRVVIKALRAGEAVVFFPEGQLTRTGTLSPLQPGFEIIARKAAVPVVPVWCDGAWGSIFSFERNRFFRKFPRHFGHGIRVAYGKPIPGNELDMKTLRQALDAASAAAIASRFDHTDARRSLANGHQLGMVNALPRREPFHMLRSDPLAHELHGLVTAFPRLFGAKPVLHDHFDGSRDARWVGGDALRSAIDVSQITARGIQFYDFGSQASIPVERTGLLHLPGLAMEGAIVSMSMPHPPQSSDPILPVQPGHKPQTLGRLLPGWWLAHSASGTLTAHGPAAPADGIPLVDAAWLDDDGFLAHEAGH